MRNAIVATLAALALTGCATMDKLQDGCRLILSEPICAAAGLLGGVIDDVGGVAETAGVIEGGEGDAE